MTKTLIIRFKPTGHKETRWRLINIKGTILYWGGSLSEVYDYAVKFIDRTLYEDVEISPSAELYAMHGGK